MFGFSDTSDFQGSWRYCDTCRLGPKHPKTDDLSLQLEVDKIATGFIGTPVWDETLHHAIGIVTHIPTTEVQTSNSMPIHATPIGILRELYTELPIDPPTSSLYH